MGASRREKGPHVVCGNKAPDSVTEVLTRKHTIYALVKAHGRTEVYVTVLATGRKNVNVFQPVSSDNHLSVDTMRRREAQELHSIPAARQQ